MKASDTNETSAQQAEAQELLLAELLARVMEKPLTPLQQQIAGLDTRISAIEAMNKDTNELYLPAIQEELGEEAEIRTIIRDLQTNVRAGLQQVDARLVSAADRFEKESQRQSTHDEVMSDRLLESSARLGELLEQAEAARNIAGGVAEGIEQARRELKGIQETAQQASVEIVTGLDGLKHALAAHDMAAAEKILAVQRDVSQQCGALSGAIDSSVDRLAQAQQKLSSAQQDLVATVVTTGVDRLEATLGGRAADSAAKLSAVQGDISGKFDALSGSIDSSAERLVLAQEKLSGAQQEFLSSVVQKELAAQLLPLRQKANWLAAACCVSCIGTAGLFALLLLR